MIRLMALTLTLATFLPLGAANALTMTSGNTSALSASSGHVNLFLSGLQSAAISSNSMIFMPGNSGKIKIKQRSGGNGLGSLMAALKSHNVGNLVAFLRPVTIKPSSQIVGNSCGANCGSGSVQAIPEPSAAAVFAVGALLVGRSVRRRSR